MWTYKTVNIKCRLEGIDFEIEVKFYHESNRTVWVQTTNKMPNGDAFKGEHYTYSSVYGINPIGQEFSFTHPVNFDPYSCYFKVSIGEVYELIKRYNKKIEQEILKYVKTIQ